MSLVFMDNLNHYKSVEDVGSRWDRVGGMNSNLNNLSLGNKGRSGEKSIGMTSHRGSIDYTLPHEPITGRQDEGVYVAFDYYVDGELSALTNLGDLFGVSSNFVSSEGVLNNYFTSLSVSGSGSLILRRASVELARQTNIISSRTLHRIEFLGVHDRSGYIKVWVDGNLAIDFVGDTWSRDRVGISMLRFNGFFTNNQDVYSHFSNFVICDSLDGPGPGPDNFPLGNVVVDTVPVTEEALSDVPSDGDESYISIDDGRLYSYGLSPIPSDSTILATQAYVYARSDETVSRIFDVSVGPNTESFSAGVSNEYANYILPVNITDVSELNSAKIDIRLTDIPEIDEPGNPPEEPDEPEEPEEPDEPDEPEEPDEPDEPDEPLDVVVINAHNGVVGDWGYESSDAYDQLNAAFKQYDVERESVRKLPFTLDTSQSTNLAMLFSGCEWLEEVPELDTRNVTDTSEMFLNCYNLRRIPPMDTSKVERMRGMFLECHQLEMAPQRFSTSSAINADEVFWNCHNLRQFPILDTSKAQTTIGMFYGCNMAEGEINYDFSSSVDVSYLFLDCFKLKHAPNMNFSSAVDATEVFSCCRSLLTVGEITLGSTESVSAMFFECFALESIAGVLDLSNVLYSNNIFYMCYSLKDGSVRTTGFNPEARDWEYELTDTRLTQFPWHNASGEPVAYNEEGVEVPAPFVPKTYLPLPDVLVVEPDEDGWWAGDYIISEILKYDFNPWAVDKLPFSLDLTALTELDGLFWRWANLVEAPDLGDISHVTSMNLVFGECTSLTTIPEYDTSSVEDMGYLFSDCMSLVTAPMLDTSSVTTMEEMFARSRNLKHLPLYNTSNVESLNFTFSHNYNLTSVPHFNTENVSDFRSTFHWCMRLVDLPTFDLSGATQLHQTFNGLGSLRVVPHFDMSHVESIYGLFANCVSVGIFPNFNLSSAEDLSYMFENCQSMLVAPLLDAPNLKNINGLFYGCRNLHLVPDIHTSNVLFATNMFQQCEKLYDGFVRLLGKHPDVQDLTTSWNGTVTGTAIDGSGLTRMPWFDPQGNPIYDVPDSEGE